MRSADIVVGMEVGVGRTEYEKKYPRQGTVVAVGVTRQMATSYRRTAKDGVEIRFGSAPSVVFTPAAIIGPWSEVETALKERQERERSAKIAAEKRERARRLKLRRVQEALGVENLPGWSGLRFKDSRFMTEVVIDLDDLEAALKKKGLL